MRQAIVIATTPDGSPFLDNLLRSIRGYDKYPVLILSNYGYELGKIKYITDNTLIDEFVLLHETCEIKDPGMFESVFSQVGRSISLCASPPPAGSYLAKYRREVLEKMDIPVVSTKLESVDQEEIFNRSYPDKWYYLDPPLINSDVFVEKYGQKRMVLENKYLIKYKSVWSRSQL